ncbi:hypothetical protein CEXT_308541 [Caerostris extrusa]|uniref:Uncharacterized protein n=1 Tax=Caerostris extrusa TaxID=172846 RepID=A0AAV4YAN2_CAEEX|nr:hypothetical protein CEXT_308541 [Caerostris extrusa]
MRCLFPLSSIPLTLSSIHSQLNSDFLRTEDDLTESDIDKEDYTKSQDQEIFKSKKGITSIFKKAIFYDVSCLFPLNSLHLQLNSNFLRTPRTESELGKED